jgi:hypothetical protein
MRKKKRKKAERRNGEVRQLPTVPPSDMKAIRCGEGQREKEKKEKRGETGREDKTNKQARKQARNGIFAQCTARDAVVVFFSFFSGL